MQVLGLSPDPPNQKLCGWGTAVCVLTGPPGADSDVCRNWTTSDSQCLCTSLLIATDEKVFQREGPLLSSPYQLAQ